MWSLRVAASLALILSLLSAPPAQADDASEAQLQFELGAELYGQRRFAEALERFLSSNRLVPNSNVTFNIAQTYEVMRRWPDAYNWYETYLRQFELDDAARARGVEARDRLAGRVAVLDVVTIPPGARLYVDRVELGSVGESPRRVAVEPGERTILARAEGHRDAEVTVTSERGRVIAASCTLEERVGRVRIVSTPQGATVVAEDDRELGTTPLELTLRAGEHRVRVRQRGFTELTRRVHIEEGASSTLTVTLERVASSVALLTVSAPAGANVRIDERAVGTAPLTLSALEPGRRRVAIHAPGREPWAEDLVLEAGSATRVTASLVDPSTALALEILRWASYGIGAAGVIAGVSVGAFALTRRDAFFSSVGPTRGQLDEVSTLNATADALMIGGALVLAATLVLDLSLGPHRSRADVRTDR